MDKNHIYIIIDTLKEYSATADEVLSILQNHDYRDEAKDLEKTSQPTVIEVEHPTLHNLYVRLARYIGPIPYIENNLSRDRLLDRSNLEGFISYLQATQDTLIAARFNRISIEPMLGVVNEFNNLSLTNQAERLNKIYLFAYGIRKWAHSMKNGNGTTIQIKLEANIEEIPKEDADRIKRFKIFEGLFKKSCNYSTSQKRALFEGLTELYSSLDVKRADRTVMAVILLFRKPKTIYKQPFGVKSITTCKEVAMESFGRDTSTIRSYSENSLNGNPRLGQEHVKRAEDIIAKALERTK